MTVLPGRKKRYYSAQAVMKDKGKLSFVDRIILWLNYLCCFALLISYLAPSVDPRKFWLLAFFGLAYPFLLAATLIFLLYWVLRKKWHMLLNIVCIVLGWHVLQNNISFHKKSEDTKQQSGSIRIMTYNVHNFKRYGAANDISTKHDILKIINEEQPDIINFQEFYSRNKGEYDLRDSILKIMATRYYYFEPFMFNSTESIGMAIFSKYPITAHGLVDLSEHRTENSCLYADVMMGSHPVRIYNVHLQSIRFDPEDYKYINRISQEGKTDVSSVKHLGSKLKSAFIKRSAQVDILKKNTAQCPYPYIISGDFNDTPSSYAVNSISSGLKNAFCEKGSGFGRTYNGDFPNYQIDYIMTTQQFDVSNYQVIEKRLSDHFAVRSDVTLR